MPEECYVYGRSVHNQRIECYWSQFITQWAARWQEIFKDIESNGHFFKDNHVDQMVMVYVFMPIIIEEVEIHRRLYNAYPMRNNPLTPTPNGVPEDNYFLAEPAEEFSVSIDPIWMQRARDVRLHDFDAEMTIYPNSRARLDQLMQESPVGVEINIRNARQQYEYLRRRVYEVLL